MAKIDLLSEVSLPAAARAGRVGSSAAIVWEEDF